MRAMARSLVRSGSNECYCGYNVGNTLANVSHIPATENIKGHLFVANVRAMAHIFWPMHPPLQQQGHGLALRMAMRPSIDDSRFHPEAQEMRLRLQWAMQWTRECAPWRAVWLEAGALNVSAHAMWETIWQMCCTLQPQKHYVPYARCQGACHGTHCLANASNIAATWQLIGPPDGDAAVN